jgi:competence protein ComEA
MRRGASVKGECMSTNNFKKNLIKNILMLSLTICSISILGGCGSSKQELYMELSDNGSGSISNTSDNNLDTDTTVETQVNNETSLIYVYVCGAVTNPGVYELEAGSRLYEAVDKAGGMSEEADKTYLNMARVLTDGEQVVVYTTDQVVVMVEEAKVEAEQSGLVNINTADISELTALSGIGESRAKAIIDYREKNGAFSSIEDIKNVDGIKDGLFAKIKDQITV